MISHGDELGRTQHGNNNAYCQDNEITWIDWDLTDEQKALLRVRAPAGAPPPVAAGASAAQVLPGPQHSRRRRTSRGSRRTAAR